MGSSLTALAIGGTNIADLAPLQGIPKDYPNLPSDVDRRRKGRAVSLPEQVPRERSVPHYPWIILDRNSYPFGVGCVLSDNIVRVASDSSDLQNTLVIGVCDATFAERKRQRSTFRDYVGIPYNRAWLSVGHSVGTILLELVELKIGGCPMDHHTLETLEDKVTEVPASVPEHLPGEPVLPKKTALFLVVRILGRMAGFVLLAIFTLPLWPFYWLGALVWGSPPNVPKLWQVRRYLHLTWTSQLPAPSLSSGKRCLLFA